MTNQAAQTMPEPITVSMCPSSDYAKGWNDCLAAMLAAAPAASGGEDDEAPKPTAMQIRYAEGYSDGVRDTERIAKERESSAAPASELARELRERAEAHGGGVFVSIGDIRAIEQALTQQRGHGEAVDRDAWAEALELPQGYTVEEFLPGGWHYAWTRADGERMVSGATWNHPALAAIAAWQYAPATTPQPSADAVREIYDAAAKGFHTSETNGEERKYLHVIRFQSIEDLHGYEDAWTAAMVKARDAK